MTALRATLCASVYNRQSASLFEVGENIMALLHDVHAKLLQSVLIVVFDLPMTSGRS